MKRLKKLALPIVIMGLALGSSACGTASSAINELCLVYSGGITEDADYEKLLPPGSNNNSIGMGSDSYCYRIDQRSYIGSTREGADTTPVEVVSNDDVRLVTNYELYFTLNQTEEIIRQFHEDLGVKTNAWEEEGWRELLRDYMEPHITRALESAALQFNWRDLYGSEEARVAFAQASITNFRRNINEVVGGDYFCGPGYTGDADSECGDITLTIGRPSPVNQDIILAIEREQTAAAETAAQAQENLRIQQELLVEAELVALYGPDGALLREAIRNGQVQIMVVPEGGNVVVPTPAPNG